MSAFSSLRLRASAALVGSAALIALSACSAGSGATPTTPPAGIVSAKLGDATVVSGAVTVDGSPTSRTGGKVSKLDNGCLGLVSINGKSTFVVFPAGTTVKDDKTLDAPSYGELALGKDVTMTGSIFAADAVPQTVKDVPAECTKDADFVFFSVEEK